MVQWRIDGNYTQSDISQQNSLPMNDVSITGRETVELRVDDANPGTEVKLRIFDQLGDNGYPLSGDTGAPYECTLSSAGPCTMRPSKNGGSVIRIHPIDPGKVRMFVIQAFYPSLEDIDINANITDYSISWAVRDAGR